MLGLVRHQSLKGARHQSSSFKILIRILPCKVSVFLELYTADQYWFFFSVYGNVISPLSRDFQPFIVLSRVEWSVTFKNGCETVFLAFPREFVEKVGTRARKGDKGNSCPACLLDLFNFICTFINFGN